MEGRRNKKRKKDRKEVIYGERKKKSTGFKLVRLVLLVFLFVKWEEVVGRIGSTFLPS